MPWGGQDGGGGFGVVAARCHSEAAGADAPTFGGGWTATLALRRSQAVRLIQAESFARQVRLIPS